MAKQKLPVGMVKRGRVYWADFVYKGTRYRRALAEDLDTAADILIELRAKARKTPYGMLDNDCQVDRIKDQWIRHLRQTKKPGTVQRYEYSLAAILPAMPPKVDGITMEVVLAYRQRRLDEGVSPRTVNHDVGTLSTMLNRASGNSKKNRLPVPLIATNPLRCLERLQHDHPKEGRPLERDEVSRLLERSPKHWSEIWYAFLVTGMRKNELASLTFDDIDWAAREITVQRGIAKNHCRRRIPIDDGLWAILCRHRDGRGDRKPGWGKTVQITDQIQARFTKDHVFTSSQHTPLSHRSGLYHAFMRCCNLAGIETRRMGTDGHEVDHVDLHSLRRSYATDLIERGADPKTVQELLGHKTLAMTMNLYAKIRSGSKRQAVARLSWGAGSHSPDGVIEFPAKQAEGLCHKFPTVNQKSEVG